MGCWTSLGVESLSGKRMWLLRKWALLRHLKENVTSAEAGTAVAVGSRDEWEVAIQAPAGVDTAAAVGKRDTGSCGSGHFCDI